MSTFASPRAALEHAAKMLGGQAAIAVVCQLPDRRNVWPWFNVEGRRVPAEHCPLIEQATKGAVRCEDLRPDIAWNVLRQQSQAAA